ncbi:hypothetical protein M758_6G119000 [Ceratodon purpureus]|nr:hypothetical protein M758_6G119000 [Ceratodon purpureus]
MGMDDDHRMDVENALLGPYQEKSKTFSSLKNKPFWVVQTALRLDRRVYYVLALLTVLSLFYIGSRSSPIILFVFVICTGSLVYAVYLANWVLAKDEGPPEMSELFRDGAEGFFRTQYGSISRMAGVLAFIILGIYMFRKSTPEQDAAGLEKSTLAFITVLSFLLGALCSGIAGYIGMWVSVRANVRVSSAARRSAPEALLVAVRAGGFSALIVVGMTVMGVAVLFASFYVFLGVDTVNNMKMTELPLLLVGYGFGASFVALFAQLGGGIYTKAADVGADLVGKVEQGIPEDDARNPAVIADLVGDNVGDCAGVVPICLRVLQLKSSVL